MKKGTSTTYNYDGSLVSKMALKCKIILLLSLVVAIFFCCLNADTGVMYRAYKAHTASIPQRQENSGYKKEAKGTFKILVKQDVLIYNIT